jgi:hypothetical protein
VIGGIVVGLTDYDVYYVNYHRGVHEALQARARASIREWRAALLSLISLIFSMPRHPCGVS